MHTSVSYATIQLKNRRKLDEFRIDCHHYHKAHKKIEQKTHANKWKSGNSDSE